MDLLNLRRQVILYGPPGTGKTYLALKTAETIAPQENVRMVQFHPAYSYEDFFEGYRPRRGEGGVVGFELTAGPFRRIVEDAREHPDQPYVLIVVVDENERGAKAYERILPGFRRSFRGGRPKVSAPVDDVPAGMLQVTVTDIWRGWFYCLEFVTPTQARQAGAADNQRPE